MVNEIGAGVGGALTISGAMMMFRYLNQKIEKKQDKNMCVVMHDNIKEAQNKSEEDHEKVMKILSEIQIATGKIEQQLVNGKT